jgi:hypothetical protein
MTQGYLMRWQVYLASELRLSSIHASALGHGLGPSSRLVGLYMTPSLGVAAKTPCLAGKQPFRASSSIPSLATGAGKGQSQDEPEDTRLIRGYCS